MNIRVAIDALICLRYCERIFVKRIVKNCVIVTLYWKTRLRMYLSLKKQDVST